MFTLLVCLVSFGTCRTKKVAQTHELCTLEGAPVRVVLKFINIHDEQHVYNSFFYTTRVVRCITGAVKIIALMYAILGAHLV